MSESEESKIPIMKAKKFGRFALIWYSEQFAIPFWMVGHVHLHFKDYHDFIEYGASFLMHAAVAVGFWLGWKDYDGSIPIENEGGESNDQQV